MTSSKQKTFTLIELLVVIAIIGILASLLLPALKSARGSARQAACKGNQKQIGIAFQMYYDDNEGAIPPALDWNTGTQYGWDDSIRTYLTNNEIPYSELINDSWWSSDKMVQTFICPSASERQWNGDNSRTINSYAMPATWNTSLDIRNRFSVWWTAGSGDLQSGKISELDDTSGTIVLSEIDLLSTSFTYLTQGSGNMLWDPEVQVEQGQNGLPKVIFGSNANWDNKTLDLHNQEKVNYLLADGHVESHHPYSRAVIGAGTPVNPQGMWTPNKGD